MSDCSKTVSELVETLENRSQDVLVSDTDNTVQILRHGTNVGVNSFGVMRSTDPEADTRDSLGTATSYSKQEVETYLEDVIQDESLSVETVDVESNPHWDY